MLFLLAAALQSQYSCKKDNSGAPVVKRVRLLDSTARDSFFIKALPGTAIVIQGANFDGLMSVSFNNLPAAVNTALSSATNILVRIPANTPTPATDPNVPNQIKVVTSHGQATYSFTVVPPGPTISSTSNENAVSGQTITITGSNFYSLSNIQFPGNINVTAFTVSPDATQVTVTVPAGITTGDSLRFTGKYGNGSSTFIFDNYLSSSTGYLANFDNGPYFGWQYWGGNKTSDGSLFPGNTGAYIEVHPVNTPITAGDGGWYSDNRAVMVAAGAWVGPNNMSDPISNYALKFEVSVSSPWTAGSMIIRSSALQDDKKTWAYLARYAPWETAPANKFVTTGWVTVTIPLTQFLSTATGNSAYNSSGTTAANFAALMGGTSSECDLMLINDGKTALTAFDAAFDNVRIVKVN